MHFGNRKCVSASRQFRLPTKITVGARQQKGITSDVTSPHRAGLTGTTTSVDRTPAYRAILRIRVRDEEITSVQRGAGRMLVLANGIFLSWIRFLLDDGTEVDGSLPLLPGRAELSDGDVQPL
jgi:hypothetical protein